MAKAIIVALAATAIIAAGCNKDLPETNEPVITVYSPTNNAVVQVNDSLIIRADFSDDSDLVNYQANIRNKNTDTNVFSYAPYLSGNTASLDTFKIMPDTGHYELVLYTGDVNDNFKNLVIDFTVVP